MWKISRIYEADYGCEERAPGAQTMCLVCLENEKGEQRQLEVADAWLVENGLDEGSVFPDKTE